MTPDPTPDETGPAAPGHLYPHAAASGRDPSRAIETKKAQAAANRDKIAAAIAVLQKNDQPVNVQSVARAAGVHPMTLRRNPTLLAEVQRLREASWRRPPTRHADPEASASYRTLKARLVASQQEVADLRRQLGQLRKDAHHALGTATRTDSALVDGLQREAAELRVQLMNEQDTTRGLRDTVRDLQDELTATHEIARGYLRDLDQAKADLRSARQELMKLRTPAAREESPEPPRAAATGRIARRNPAGPWVDLADAIGPGWRLVRDTDSTRPGQLWHVEHDQERVGTVRRESTLRGRTAWSARTAAGHDVAAPSAFAVAAGSRLWRTRDLAAAGLAQRSTPPS